VTPGRKQKQSKVCQGREDQKKIKTNISELEGGEGNEKTTKQKRKTASRKKTEGQRKGRDTSRKKKVR